LGNDTNGFRKRLCPLVTRLRTFFKKIAK
jgi:hypothetical protein